jgi:hypothetical protein
MNKIAFLNDGPRRTFARGKVVMTASVAALTEEELTKVNAFVTSTSSQRTMTRTANMTLEASNSAAHRASTTPSIR